MDRASTDNNLKLSKVANNYNDINGHNEVNTFSAW